VNSGEILDTSHSSVAFFFQYFYPQQVSLRAVICARHDHQAWVGEQRRQLINLIQRAWQRSAFMGSKPLVLQKVALFVHISRHFSSSLRLSSYRVHQCLFAKSFDCGCMSSCDLEETPIDQNPLDCTSHIEPCP